MEGHHYPGILLYLGGLRVVEDGNFVPELKAVRYAADLTGFKLNSYWYKVSVPHDPEPLKSLGRTHTVALNVLDWKGTFLSRA